MNPRLEKNQAGGRFDATIVLHFMKRKSHTPRSSIGSAALALCIAVVTAYANPTTYENAGLDRIIGVTLERSGAVVTGTAWQVGYEGEDRTEGRFSGKILGDPSSRNKPVKMEVRFQGEIPYDAPEGKQIWTLRLSGKEPILLIPILGRDFESTPPKVKNYEIELQAK